MPADDDDDDVGDDFDADSGAPPQFKLNLLPLLVMLLFINVDAECVGGSS